MQREIAKLKNELHQAKNGKRTCRAEFQEQGEIFSGIAGWEQESLSTS
jgi:hypothetical protein